jgi:hypothetical protein
LRLDVIECSVPILISKIRDGTINGDEIGRLQDTLQALIKAARISCSEIQLLPYQSNNVIYIEDWKSQ